MIYLTIPRDDIFNDGFASKIKKSLQDELLKQYNPAKGDVIFLLMSYYYELSSYNNLLEILKEILYKIMIVKYNEYYQLKLSENTKLEKADIFIVDISNMIEYGTLEFQGYPIISNIMKDVESSLNYLYFINMN